jgi:hypothetical protein
MGYELSSLGPATPEGSFGTTTKVPFGTVRFSFIASFSLPAQAGAVYSAGLIVSGHTVKHLAAAAACFAVLRYFQTRQLIN